MRPPTARPSLPMVPSSRATPSHRTPGGCGAPRRGTPSSLAPRRTRGVSPRTVEWRSARPVARTTARSARSAGWTAVRLSCSGSAARSPSRARSARTAPSSSGGGSMDRGRRPPCGPSIAMPAESCSSWRPKAGRSMSAPMDALPSASSGAPRCSGRSVATRPRSPVARRTGSSCLWRSRRMAPSSSGSNASSSSATSWSARSAGARPAASRTSRRDSAGQGRAAWTKRRPRSACGPAERRCAFRARPAASASRRCPAS